MRHIWLDSDGNTEVLIPLFIELGITVHWPLERAAGMDPLKIRQTYGHALGLAGGIDKRELAKDRSAIAAELYRHVPQLLEDGGYIPTLDHAVPPDISYDNWLYYLELKCRLLGGDPGTIPALRERAEAVPLSSRSVESGSAIAAELAEGAEGARHSGGVHASCNTKPDTPLRTLRGGSPGRGLSESHTPQKPPLRRTLSASSAPFRSFRRSRNSADPETACSPHV